MRIHGKQLRCLLPWNKAEILLAILQVRNPLVSMHYTRSRTWTIAIELAIASTPLFRHDTIGPWKTNQPISSVQITPTISKASNMYIKKEKKSRKKKKGNKKNIPKNRNTVVCRTFAYRKWRKQNREWFGLLWTIAARSCLECRGSSRGSSKPVEQLSRGWQNARRMRDKEKRERGKRGNQSADTPCRARRPTAWLCGRLRYRAALIAEFDSARLRSPPLGSLRRPSTSRRNATSGSLPCRLAGNFHGGCVDRSWIK